MPTGLYQVTNLHDDPASRVLANGNIKEDLGVNLSRHECDDAFCFSCKDEIATQGCAYKTNEFKSELREVQVKFEFLSFGGAPCFPPPHVSLVSYCYLGTRCLCPSHPHHSATRKYASNHHLLVHPLTL